MDEMKNTIGENNKIPEGIGFLFDLDGVLIDSETEYTRIWEEIDRKYPTGVENFAIKIKGMTLPEILAEYFPENIHDSVITLLNEKEQKMKYRPLPGAIEILTRLKEKGHGAILVTSSNDYKMRHLREELPDLENYFYDIVTADKVHHSKPDPEGYLLGASLLGVPARRCVVFEDSVQGVKAGRASGAYTVGMTTTLPASSLENYTDELAGTLADVDIDKIIQILRAR